MKHSFNTLLFALSFICITCLGLFSIKANAASKTLTTGNYYYTYIYDKNGEKKTTYNGKSAHLTTPQTFTYYGTPKKIKNNYYYQIGNDAFIKTNDIGILNGKTTLQLNYNSYIYDKNGNRLHKTALSKKFPVITELSLKNIGLLLTITS